MAALPYMQFYVADYLADTAHLSTEEHGAYLLLIFNYWQTGKPIPKNRLHRIARMPDERWSDAESSLSEFFRDNGSEWIHERIEADLAAAREAQAQRAAAGKASAEARKAAKRDLLKRERNGRSTGVQRDESGPSTNKEQNRTEQNKEKDNGSADADPARENSPSKKFTDDDFEKFWKFCREHWFGRVGNKSQAKEAFNKLTPGEHDLREILRLTRQECEYRRRTKATEGFCENMKHVVRWIKHEGWNDTRERLESGPTLSVIQGSDPTKVNAPYRGAMPRPDRPDRQPTGTEGGQ